VRGKAHKRHKEHEPRRFSGFHETVLLAQKFCAKDFPHAHAVVKHVLDFLSAPFKAPRNR